MLFRLCIPLLIILLLISCSHPAVDQPENQLGTITFSVTGKPEAQPHFQKGLLLLHSFEYQDAADEFRQAIHLDTNFVMAYWGEAMTYNHSLWRFQDLEKATAVLNQLAFTDEYRVEKAVTPLEKDFIRAINILYGPGTKAARDSNYAVFMGKLHDQYPGDDEVTAFYSIALLGSVQVGRDDKVYGLAADMAREVLKHNPNHPGALHYLIHASDDPQHAGTAVATADAYAMVAPGATHALHMPTHIYLALGLWDKVISSNIAAWEASKARKERKQLTNDALGYHTYHWLMYGYLQKGNTETAKAIVDTMHTLCSALSSENAREHMVFQKSTYLAETNEYGSAINDIEVKMSDLNIVTRAMNYFTDGMNGYYQSDEAGLKEIITKLTREIGFDKERITVGDSALCGNISSATPNQLDMQQSEVMLLELRALQARLMKDDTKFEKYMKDATAEELTLSYAFGPPTIVKPSFELYGDWLLEKKRPAEALQQYELSLKTAPGRRLALAGKKNAEAMMGGEKKM
jgi:tetratricopeptide (TPR) repeat protein